MQQTVLHKHVSRAMCLFGGLYHVLLLLALWAFSFFLPWYGDLDRPHSNSHSPTQCSAHTNAQCHTNAGPLPRTNNGLSFLGPLQISLFTSYDDTEQPSVHHAKRSS